LRERQPKNEELSKFLQEIPENKPSPVFSSENDKQRELIIQKLEEWVSQGEIYVNSEKAPNFVTSLESLGLMAKDKLEVLFGVMIEHAIEKTKFLEEENYSIIDSFAKLVQVILLMAPTGMRVKNLIVLMTAIKNLILKAANTYFNPRPYFRLFMLILTDITQPSPTYTEPVTVQEMLVPIASTLHLLNPMRVPGFCFAWLDLISHRFFMPKMLRTVNPSSERQQVPVQWSKMSVLIIDLLKFIYHNYNTFPLSESLRAFYNGTLKIIFVIMSDFPEFLCDYHYDFCNYIPEHCLQLRNLILSPYPKAMRPPSPFIPNLKVDLLPEMKIAPNILSNFKVRLGSLKEDIDHYFMTRDISAIQDICSKLKTVEMKANAIAANSLVLTVAEMAVNGQVDQRFFNEFFLAILMGLDNESRKHLINAVANQLRYPNSHTQYFSCVMLHMFSECKKPFVEEQIAKILTERSSAHRPHPWGLLITMIELVKNPRYEFLKKPFTHSTPDIENFYEKISKNFMGDQMDFS
jgi:CCR4-NOT transcription complex subunit 1